MSQVILYLILLQKGKAIALLELQQNVKIALHSLSNCVKSRQNPSISDLLVG